VSSLKKQRKRVNRFQMLHLSTEILHNLLIFSAIKSTSISNFNPNLSPKQMKLGTKQGDKALWNYES